MSEEKPKKRRAGPGYNVGSEPHGPVEMDMGMPTPKGKPIVDPNAESKKAVHKARGQTSQS